MVDQGTLDRCLRGISFPAHKGAFVKGASGNGCPSEAIIALVELPERTYGSERDLLCQLGDSGYCSPESPTPALEGLGVPYARRVPGKARGHTSAGALARRPGGATRRTTVVVMLAALIAAAIVVWLVTSVVLAR